MRNGRRFTVEVRADGDDRTVSHVGGGLLVATADELGMTGAISDGLAGLRRRRGRHDPGRVVRDLAVVLADGGDCLADLRGLRDQAVLFGPVASDATAFRVLDAVAERRLEGALTAGRGAVIERLRSAEAWPAGPLVVDIDATLVSSHSDKDGASPTYKRGFGFHPMLAYLDTPGLGPGGLPLAGLLRPGNAGANTAADHISVLDDALEVLPREVAENAEIVVRCDSAGATHAFLDHCRAARIQFSVGLQITETLREQILDVEPNCWRPALTADGTERDNGQVVEITHALDLTAWPESSRVIVRRERPHPGAQLSFTDCDGHRFQAILTDQPGEPAKLERAHRARARVEDRIRAAKDTGLTNLPFRDFDLNAVWVELALCAQTLTFAAQALLLTDDLAHCEPKRLRYRLLHTAGRLAFHARTARLRLPASWPWAQHLAAAFTRLAALQAPG
ncbi:MAG TPA: IS1380 family transposase [Rhizobiaceae bacterium]